MTTLKQLTVGPVPAGASVLLTCAGTPKAKCPSGLRKNLTAPKRPRG